MSHRDRLAWARRHLDTLKKSIDDFIKSKPYHVRTEPHPEGGNDRYRGVLVVRQEPPIRDWGLMVGDIIHSLRSSLDNLAYGLEVAHSGPPSDPKKVQVQFIIFDESKDFPSGYFRIARMSPAVQAVIETLQPYNRTDRTHRHPLSVLRDLSNVDKHRKLLVVFAFSSEVKVTAITELERIALVSGYVGPFIDGAVIAAWKHFRPPDLEVNMHFGMTLEVQFPHEWPAWSGNVIPFLKGLCDHIEEQIFTKLEPFL